MRKFMITVFMTICLFPVLSGKGLYSLKPIGWINDYAGIITADMKEKISAQIKYVEKNNGAEIAVVTIKSLDGESIEGFSNTLFNSWGIGKKDKNNGVLVVVAVKEKKIRIEVGLGLEAVITNMKAKDIIRVYMAPNFKTGQYGAGIMNGVAAIAEYIIPGYNTGLNMGAKK